MSESLQKKKFNPWDIVTLILALFFLLEVFFINSFKNGFERLETKITLLELQSDEIKHIKELTQQIIKSASSTESAEKTIKIRSFSPNRNISQDKRLCHQVNPGETLYSISKRYRISVNEIRHLNNLNKNQVIQSGQKLLVASARQW